MIVTDLTVRAPAKLNLQLAVGAARPDQYHDLVTVFHAVSLFDEVTVRPAAGIQVRTEGEGAADVPDGDGNLAVKAALALRAAAGVTGGAEILIRKDIPVAAGLAGGSADAAAALVACNELWRAGLDAAALHELAAGIGSDVPFGLIGGTTVGTGRGELLTPALARGGYHWVLAFAGEALSTAGVYAAFDRLSAANGDAPGPPELDEALMAALRAGDPAAVGARLSNDLEPAALSLRPQLRRTLAAGREHGALGAVLAGSGPTCAFLAADAEHALNLAVALTSTGVCRGVARVSGPVSGAAMVDA
jgi:4-diphosphocytidyl-2-C-methyl-D-erythritol kinase